MESQNIEFRTVIKFLTKEGARAKEIHLRIADVYDDSSTKYSTVAKWSAEFKCGRDSNIHRTLTFMVSLFLEKLIKGQNSGLCYVINHKKSSKISLSVRRKLRFYYH